MEDVIVVGAGIAGLALARALRERGHEPLVLERARGVGGRCATRRIDGRPVDHGVAFLHGRDPRFLAALAALPEDDVLVGWPHVRVGDGVPCQPRAFAEHERRLAPVRGVSAFAKALAVGTRVRVNSRVVSVAPTGGASGARGWDLALEDGGTLRARALVLTLPAPRAAELLRPAAAAEPALREALPLFDLVRPVPCLTVIAEYGDGAPRPEWDAWYPSAGDAAQLVIHDSAKRGGSARTTLVIQARPKWSRAHLQAAPGEWQRSLLDAAAEFAGAWVATPVAAQAHAWRLARVPLGSELSAPLLLSLSGGALLGVAGDGWHESGGVEGAYLSGAALAARLHHGIVTHV